MANLKEIKSNIRSIDRTHKVTKAMEAVSAVKMRRSQENAFAGRPYTEAAMRVLHRVAGSLKDGEHSLTETRPVSKTAVLVVTSDKGLAGNVNTALLKSVHATLKERQSEQTGDTTENTVFVCLGKKAAEHFGKRGFEILAQYDNDKDEVTLENVQDITRILTDGFIKRDFDECLIAYQQFVSTFEQRPTVRKILPLSVSELERISSAVYGPNAGESEESARQPGYTIEPDAEAVLDELLPSLVNIFTHHTLIEAKASEHSARMVAMKNASDKSKEKSRELTLAFNKERQAVITREVSEIVGGIEAMGDR